MDWGLARSDITPTLGGLGVGPSVVGATQLLLPAMRVLSGLYCVCCHSFFLHFQTPLPGIANSFGGVKLLFISLPQMVTVTVGGSHTENSLKY